MSSAVVASEIVAKFDNDEVVGSPLRREDLPDGGSNTEGSSASAVGLPIMASGRSPSVIGGISSRQNCGIKIPENLLLACGGGPREGPCDLFICDAPTEPGG